MNHIDKPPLKTARPWRWLWLGLLLGSAGISADTGQPDTPSEEPAAEEPEPPGIADFFGIAMSGQFRVAGLRERAAKMDNKALIAALAELHLAEMGRAEKSASDPEAIRQLRQNLPGKLPGLLLRILENPDTMAQLEWLPVERMKVASAYFDDWQSKLELRGRDADARLDVEPLEALFNTTIKAAALGNYLVVEDGEILSEITLIDLAGNGPDCCRVLNFPAFGDDPPTAFKSIREFLEFEWMSGELVRPYLNKK